jgi:hypothetical protein
MDLHFLVPADPLRTTEVEEMFAEQFSSVRDAGFGTSLCPDSAIQGRKPLRDVPAGATVVYRGWMMTAPEYGRLAEAIASASATPLTPPAAYLAAHHLPNWYPLVREFTAETRVLPATADPEAELRAIGWDAFFVKDYVKSLKTPPGPIVREPSQVNSLVAEMRRYRGDIEGGLCVRRVETFVPDAERRYFVLDGKPYGPTGERVPELVKQVAERIPSPFFSVDVALRQDGVLRVVEVGDGQVSDLVGWSAPAFAAMWIAARPAT